MKLERNEFGHDYGSYRFGYCEHAVFEPGDRASNFYEKGYLPYSADPAVLDRFYMARSARIPLTEFMLTSENRRIAKRFDGTFRTRIISREEFGEKERKLFLEYFEGKHGSIVMPEDRLEGILKTPLPIRFALYEGETGLAAVVLEVIEGSSCHIWFPAYDLAYAQQSLGMWLMLDRLRCAQAEGKTHCYLGTVYGEKALYKTNFEPLEFWDGSSWSRNLEELKTRARQER